MRRLTRFLTMVALLLGWGVGRAPGEADGVLADVRPLTGAVRRGQVRAIDAEHLGLETTSGPREIAWTELREVDFVPPPDGRPGAWQEDHLRLRLTGGEVLLGRFVSEAPDGLVLETPEAGRLTIPLEVLATLVVVPGDVGPCHEPEHGYPPAERRDVAYVRNGDEYSGVLLSLRASGVVMETGRDTTREVSWDDLQVLQLENDEIEPPVGLSLELETWAGARWIVDAAGRPAVEGEALVFAPRSLPNVRASVPLASLASIHVGSPAFAYACHLPFRAEFHDRFDGGEEDVYAGPLGRWREARVDRTQGDREGGCPLRLGGRTYRHGFAVHARSLVHVDLAGGFRTFEAVFGIDDEVLDVPTEPPERRGDVDARVVVDGKTVWEAKGVKGGEPPRTIGPIDVKGAKELVLVVDFGGDWSILDRATWADPILIR